MRTYHHTDISNVEIVNEKLYLYINELEIELYNAFFEAAETEEDMEIMEYIIERIDGDYAQLRRTDVQEDDLKLVARAFLPPDIIEGTRLAYELFEYFVIKD